MLRLKKDKTPDADDLLTTPASDSANLDSDAPTKKATPKPVWIAAGVGSVALLGLAAYFLTRPAPESDTPPLTTSVPGGNSVPGMPPMPGMNSTGSTTAVSTTVTTPSSATMPGANGVAMPSGTPASTNAITTTTTVTSGAPPVGAPGMLPGAPASPATTQGATPAPPPMPVVAAANVRPGPGAPPTLAPPVMNARPLLTPLTPALAAQLKVLWLEGAAAKHRGDYEGARAAWTKALRLRPGHPGFAEAIRNLPTRRQPVRR